MRIIGGTHRSRRLVAPPGQRTRPTTDRVREAWFGMLGQISNLNVLELYAGSGALGIEALSRGARHCTFVEEWSVAVRTIQGNLDSLSLGSQATVLGVSVARAVSRLSPHAPFDLVLADPPWPKIEEAGRDLGRLFKAELFSDGARVFLGHPKGLPVPLVDDTGFEQVDQRAWGDSGLSVFRKARSASPPTGESTKSQEP